MHTCLCRQERLSDSSLRVDVSEPLHTDAAPLAPPNLVERLACSPCFVMSIPARSCAGDQARNCLAQIFQRNLLSSMCSSCCTKNTPKQRCQEGGGAACQVNAAVDDAAALAEGCAWLLAAARAQGKLPAAERKRAQMLLVNVHVLPALLC